MTLILLPEITQLRPDRTRAANSFSCDAKHGSCVYTPSSAGSAPLRHTVRQTDTDRYGWSGHSHNPVHANFRAHGGCKTAFTSDDTTTNFTSPRSTITRRVPVRAASSRARCAARASARGTARKSASRAVSIGLGSVSCPSSPARVAQLFHRRPMTSTGTTRPLCVTNSISRIPVS